MKCFWKHMMCLMGACGAFSVAQADLDPESIAYLLDMKYAKNIEVKIYLVTKDQVAKIFSDDTAEVVQKTNKELFTQEMFLLVRCKNTGDYRSFGTLNCKISKDGAPIKIDVRLLPGYMKTFSDTVLPMGTGIVKNDNKKPIVSYEWKSVCTI